jgi:hypothetical protein
MTIPVEAILEAACMPPDRIGQARTARLSAPELDLYRWIIRHFAETGRPSRTLVAQKAASLSLDPDQAFAALGRDDLVHLDEQGQIAVAYPFSGRPTAHRVLLDGHELAAMCAIDALGISAMLNRTVEIKSTDPINGDEINVGIDPSGQATWQPQDAVVLAGSRRRGAALEGCCQVLNFFSSRATAEQYLVANSDVRGFPITVPEAAEAGRTIFEHVLSTDP